MLHRTPLYDRHVKLGARIVDFAGWEMPVQYSSIVEEHQAVRTAAGLFDISHMGRLWFPGSQAVPLVQRIYTNNAATLKEGQVRVYDAGKVTIFEVRGGFADVTPDGLTILAEHAVEATTH